MMVTIHIPDTLASQLEARARQENRSIDDVAAEILEQHLQPPPGTLAALIKAADEADLRSSYTDTAERSREILDREYPKYLSEKYGLDEKRSDPSGE
jgi:hypothetical protein